MNVDYSTRESVTVRQPATANLMLDSADRASDLSGNTQVYKLYPTPFDFQIQKNQSLLNGFFTRIGTSEVCLEWNIPNISDNLGNNKIVFDCSQSTYTTTIPTGFYTVQELLQQIPLNMNATVGTANGAINNFSTGVTGATIGGNYSLRNTLPINFTISTTALSDTIMDQFYQNANASIHQYKQAIDLRPFRYIDITSEDLTYNQNLKDNSTAPNPRNVLNRWYFDWDGTTDLDSFGFPILMGETPFSTRRIYNPPKQIRWDPTQNIGNLRFQVYDDKGKLLTYLNNYSTLVNGVADTNWLMTLQVSEN